MLGHAYRRFVRSVRFRPIGLLAVSLGLVVVFASPPVFGWSPEERRARIERLDTLLRNLHPSTVLPLAPADFRTSDSAEVEAVTSGSLEIEPSPRSLVVRSRTAAPDVPTTTSTSLSETLMGEAALEPMRVSEDRASSNTTSLWTRLPEDFEQWLRLARSSHPPTQPATGQPDDTEPIEPTAEEEQDLDDTRVPVNSAGTDRLIEALLLDSRRARLLVEFRDVHGPFTRPEDLAQVNGITDDMIRVWEERHLLRFD